jgi:hypothetical protein
MTSLHQPFNITPDFACKLIAEQFPEYAHLPITSVEKQYLFEESMSADIGVQRRC